jgi:uroporphyrinogen decarboxylase
MPTIGQRFMRIVSAAATDDALIAIWNTAPFLNALYGVGLRDYYFDAETKLRVQLRFQDHFPEFYCFPGIWADFGALVEPHAFGCPLEWPEGGMPMAQPVIRKSGDFPAVRPIDPLKDGLMPRALDQYRYFWDHLDRKYIEEYGYLDGVATSFGPVELAAVLMGHGHFFMSLVTAPARIHELLKITTDSVIRWLEAQEKVNGALKVVSIADHIPGQVSRAHFEEFWLPYTRRVADAFPVATWIYHNEFPVPYAEALAGIRFHVFHFGGELEALKKALGDRITLAGNLHPVSLMLHGSAEEVRAEALRCLTNGAPGGRFLLSTAGGLAPGTPLVNLEAMAAALNSYRSTTRI